MTLEERIVRIERQNRWMKRAGGVGVALVGLFLTLGQGKPQLVHDTLVARSFELVDEKGKSGGVWGFDEGEALLVMKGKGGDVCSLGRSTLLLFDDNKKSEISLSITTDGPVVMIKLNSLNTVYMQVLSKELPRVGVKSEGGVAAIQVSPTEGSKLILGATREHPQAVLGVNKRGVALVLDGKAGGAALTLEGKSGTVTVTAPPGAPPSLVITDPADKEVFKAP